MERAWGRPGAGATPSIAPTSSSSFARSRRGGRSRFQLRRAVRNFTTIGVPSNRIGLALGFHSGRGGQAGLGAARWFGVVKREALAARLVASELALDSVWSRGWARFAGMPKRCGQADGSNRVGSGADHGAWKSLNTIVLAPFHPLRMRLSLPNGRHVLRFFVAAESAPAGAAIWTPPVVVRVK